MRNDYARVDENTSLVHITVPKKSYKNIILIAALILLAAIIIGLLVWFFVFHKKHDDDVHNQWYNQIVPLMNRSVNPCDDFYMYACGSYVTGTALPNNTDIYVPIFDQIGDSNAKMLYDLMGKGYPVITEFYDSCTADASSITSDSTALVSAMVMTYGTLTGGSAAYLMPIVADLHAKGVSVFFGAGAMQNFYEENSNINLALAQGGWSLPDAYLDPAARGTAIKLLALYMTTFTNMSAISDDRINASLNVMAQLRSYAGDASQITSTTAMNFSDFQTLAKVDFTPYVNAINVTVLPADTVMVTTTQFFSMFSNVLTQNTLQALGDYISFQIIFSAAMGPIFPSIMESTLVTPLGFTQTIDKLTIPKVVRKPVFDRPMDAITAQQQNCVNLVNMQMNDYVGLLFTNEIVNGTVVDDIHMITTDIQQALMNSFPALSWLDAAGQAAATDKVSNIIQIIGHPNRLEKYDGVLLNKTGVLANSIRINQANFAYGMRSIGMKYNRSEDEFDATIVNAFYNPLSNTIDFPAGILESPMYSNSMPAMFKYARMGYVIGHENTHSLDNSGKYWNKNGVYTPSTIFDATTNTNFDTQAQCLVNQYNQYSPVPGYHVNGTQTLGENIADMGGVKNSYRAYQTWLARNNQTGTGNVTNQYIDFLTNDQTFWVMLAQTWCSLYNNKGFIDQIEIDVHSPSMYRVNGPLSNFDGFSNAFNCSAGTPMNPGASRCVLW